jgi:hypothetical protein
VFSGAEVIAALEKWVPGLLNLWRSIRRILRPDRQRGEPTELLRIVPNYQDTWWAEGAKIGDLPAIQIHSQWFVTNRTDFNVKIVSVRFTRSFRRRWIVWPFRRPRQVTPAMTFGFFVNHKSVGDALPPHGHADFDAGIFPLGDSPAEGETIVGRTTFVDHLGHEYEHTTRIKNVRRRHLGDETPIAIRGSSSGSST